MKSAAFTFRTRFRYTPVTFSVLTIIFTYPVRPEGGGELRASPHEALDDSTRLCG